MRNGNLATFVQTLDNTLQKSDHYAVDKYCKKQFFIRWIEIYKMDSVIHPWNWAWRVGLRAPLVTTTTKKSLNIVGIFQYCLYPNVVLCIFDAR